MSKPQKKQAKRTKKTPKIPSFGSNLFTGIAMIFFLMALFTIFIGDGRQTEDIALSQVAFDVNAGVVEGIVVEGDTLTISYVEDEEKKSKKEVNTAITDTLVNYGVTDEKLAGVTIEIKNQSGFGYWLMTLGPFLIPIIFLGFLFWMITRQIKGVWNAGT